MTTSILLHVYHLEVREWEKLVWGVPGKDLLGTLPRLVELLLNEPACEPIDTILVCSGPSQKDGLTEGAYTKKYLLDHFNELVDFPRLKKILTTFDTKQMNVLKQRLEAIKLGPVLHNTMDEVHVAAHEFQNAHKVIQLAATTHAPRCLQVQTIARSKGVIPQGQLWFVATSDTHFYGTEPEDLLILEPPHRGDDPMAKVNPSAPQVLRAYLELDRYKKQHFIAVTQKALDDYKNQQL